MNQKRQTIGDITYHVIKQKIIEMEYEPGAHMSEDKLSKELEVSRTPLRQALYQLENEGLVIKQANGRIYVAPLSVEHVEEIYQVREVLEGLVVREATKKMNTTEIESLEKIIYLMERAASLNQRQETLRYGSEFHHLLYAPSQSETAIRFLEQLNSNIERYRRISGYKHPHYNSVSVVEEHNRLLILIKERKAEAVEKEMRAHIRRSFERTREALQFI